MGHANGYCAGHHEPEGVTNIMLNHRLAAALAVTPGRKYLKRWGYEDRADL